MTEIDIMVCGICRKIKRVNMVILGRNLCSSCEKEIVNAQAGDEAYGMYMKSIRDLFGSYAR